MSSHSPLSVARMPFGILDDSRLKGLQNVKNRQNAMPTSLSPASKRRHQAPSFAEQDTENVDPELFSAKRPKNLDGSDCTSALAKKTPVKQSRFVLGNASPSPSALSDPIKPSSVPSMKNRPIAKPTPRLKQTKSVEMAKPPTATTTPTPALTPSSTRLSSTQPGAGRSPKSKRIGAISKRRTAQPFFRVDPPSTKTRPSGPLSLDAALSGTLPSYSARHRAQSTPSPPAVAASRPALELEKPPMKDGWFFDIYEDTFEEALTNIMEFSTGVLDISDDEARHQEKNDRGKENIPPEEDLMAATGMIADTRARAHLDAALADTAAAVPGGSKTKRGRGTTADKRAANPHRAPLADLAVSDFYDEALLAEEMWEEEEAAALASDARFAPSADDKPVLAGQSTLDGRPEDLSAALIAVAAPVTASKWDLSTGDATLALSSGNSGEEEIQIWESESAAGEAQQVEPESQA